MNKPIAKILIVSFLIGLLGSPVMAGDLNIDYRSIRVTSQSDIDKLKLLVSRHPDYAAIIRGAEQQLTQAEVRQLFIQVNHPNSYREAEHLGRIWDKKIMEEAMEASKVKPIPAEQVKARAQLRALYNPKPLDKSQADILRRNAELLDEWDKSIVEQAKKRAKLKPMRAEQLKQFVKKAILKIRNPLVIRTLLTGSFVGYLATLPARAIADLSDYSQRHSYRRIYGKELPGLETEAQITASRDFASTSGLDLRASTIHSLPQVDVTASAIHSLPQVDVIAVRNIAK